MSAGAAFGLAIPAAIPACGIVYPPPPHNAYVIDAGRSGSPPVNDLAPLVSARAYALKMRVTLTNDWDLATQTAVNPVFDPVTNRYPPNNALVVALAINVAETEPTLAKALEHGVKIVSYPVAVRNQTAAITVDAAQAAVILATHAGQWAVARLSGRGGVLLVLPPPAETDSPYASAGPDIERAVRETIARVSPRITLEATIEADSSNAYGVVSAALRSHPATRIVLVWDDATSIPAAEALRRHGSAEGRLYVGALGLPAVMSNATLDALAGRGVLRAVVAPRVRDLADAMVDLPHALLNGGPIGDVRLALEILTPDSAALAAYSGDYSSTPLGIGGSVSYADLGSSANIGS
jgi:ABC-type sugar transport system substrate-binding protein